MKMYIIVKDNIPDILIPAITAHASMACYKKFEENEQMKQWMSGVFKKVVCLVNEAAFNKLKTEPEHIVMTESSLGDKEVCLAFCLRKEYTKKFKFLKMWPPQGIN